MVKIVNALFIVEVDLSSLASLQALHPNTVISSNRPLALRGHVTNTSLKQ